MTHRALKIAFGGVIAFCAMSAEAKQCDRQTTNVMLQSTRQALELYRIKHGSYPRALRSLVSAKILAVASEDSWKRSLVWIRPDADTPRGCLISKGADGRLGSRDDVAETCNPRTLNRHLLLHATLHPDAPTIDAYGRPIHARQQGSVRMAWSYGEDGLADTPDDETLRYAANAELDL